MEREVCNARGGYGREGTGVVKQENTQRRKGFEDQAGCDCFGLLLRWGNGDCRCWGWLVHTDWVRFEFRAAACEGAVLFG